MDTQQPATCTQVPELHKALLHALPLPIPTAVVAAGEVSQGLDRVPVWAFLRARREHGGRGSFSQGGSDGEGTPSPS